MAIVIDGTTGISGVDGSAGTPAVQGTDTNTGVFYPAADTVGVSTGGSERVRVDSSGNVGIGTSSPSSSSIVRFLQVDNATSSGVVLNAARKFSIYSSSSSTLSFLDDTAGAERMRIDSSGNLLVGTTTPVTTERLNVTSGQGSGVLVVNRTDNIDSNLRDMVLFRRSTTGVGSISCSNTSTSYNTSSDYRLKEDVAPMTGALAKVSSLKPVNYKWKVDGSDGQGFIAHELQEVCPDAVSGEKDAVDADGNPVYQGIDTSFLVATLTAAIQEQQALITALTARIEALEAK